jgi:carbohydrate-selective porin OprB
MRVASLIVLSLPWLALVAGDPAPVVTNGIAPLEGPTLLGDLGGLRSGFAEHGLSMEARFLADGSVYSHDGLVTGKRKGVRYYLEAGLTMDVATFAGLAGAGSITATWQSFAGDDLLGETGVLENESWINTVDRHQIGRLFYVQPFFDNAFTLKAGKDEVVRDFGCNLFATDFLNAASRREPTAWAMPTLPESASMAMAALNLGGWVARFGIYDGRSITDGKETGDDWLAIPESDVFMIGEVGLAMDDRRRGHQGGVVIGAWQHTGTFTAFDGDTKSDVRGYYLQGDLMLTQEADPRKPQGLAGWAQLGMSEDDDFSVYDRHLAIGLVWRGLIPSRDGDAIGISHSWLETSRAKGSPTDANERVLELFYGFKAAGWLTVQPDFQWFVNPGGDSQRDDLFIGSLRGEVIF